MKLCQIFLQISKIPNLEETSQKNAMENEILKHSQIMLISNFELENGTFLTALLKFHLELGLQHTKIYIFVQNSLGKGFKHFVQSVIDARREGDENPLLVVVAEIKKLLSKSS